MTHHEGNTDTFRRGGWSYRGCRPPWRTGFSNAIRVFRLSLRLSSVKCRQGRSEVEAKFIDVFDQPKSINKANAKDNAKDIANDNASANDTLNDQENENVNENANDNGKIDENDHIHDIGNDNDNDNDLGDELVTYPGKHYLGRSSQEDSRNIQLLPMSE